MAKRPLIDASDLSLEAWLSKIFLEPNRRAYVIEDSHFPSNRHREQFLESIRVRSEEEVRGLLRLFLMQSGTVGNDQYIRAFLSAQPREHTLELMKKSEFIRRLFVPPFLPWDGITWVLDLLPEQPSQALAALDAYFCAHAQHFPDGRLHGMFDAEAIIRARYLQWDNSRDVLLTLQPQEFEYIVAALYREMGYEPRVTQQTRDGGVDVEASREEPGARELVLIQCKRYKGTVGAPAIRELRGVVAERHANKGTVIATGGFTKAARAFASKNTLIELVDFADLNVLLNRAFGPKWPKSVFYRIREAQAAALKRAAKSLPDSPRRPMSSKGT
jgi:restriction system protein